jgi:hypothetical protein
VEDPYRWLEDPDGADTVKWVEAQVKVSRRGDNWLEQGHGMREGGRERAEGESERMIGMLCVSQDVDGDCREGEAAVLPDW